MLSIRNGRSALESKANVLLFYKKGDKQTIKKLSSRLTSTYLWENIWALVL